MINKFQETTDTTSRAILWTGKIFPKKQNTVF